MQAEMLAIISVAAGAYIATNLDNLTLFVVLLTRYREQRSMVIAGYLVAAALLLLVGYVIAHAAVLVPVTYVGFLGLIPILVGVFGLVQLYRGPDEPVAAETERTLYSGTALLATAGTQIGNGTDTVLTFAALFADSNVVADMLIVISIALMAIVFIAAGLASVSHPAFTRWINRYAPRITPFILILVGSYILANTAMDVMAD